MFGIFYHYTILNNKLHGENKNYNYDHDGGLPILLFYKNGKIEDKCLVYYYTKLNHINL